MKNSQLIKNSFYIKVNKKKSLKDEKIKENVSKFEPVFQPKPFDTPKSFNFTEKKNNKHEAKLFFSPINKENKLFKTNKSKEKDIKNIYTTPTNKKYEKKIIHIENNNNKNNMFKSQTQFLFKNKNSLSQSEKNQKKNKNYLNPKNILINSTNNPKRLFIKGRTDLRVVKNYSAIKLSKGIKNKYEYSIFKNMKLINNNISLDKNINVLMNTPKYSKTIINNNINQNIKNKQYMKKIKNKSKENENNNNNDKKIIFIYKTKLLTIFVKLIEDFYKRKLKRIFSIFIYKLKDESYFFDINRMNNKNLNNNLTNNRIYDYNTKINTKDKYCKFSSHLFHNKDYQSKTICHMGYIRGIENNDKNIYIPIKNRIEENNNYNNHHSNPKYKIFNNMKIEKNPKIFEENNNIYKNQNINTQINNYYNTKNTNFYFNKINSFNSLIIEKQRPRYFYPNNKNNIKQTSAEKINNLSLNSKRNIILNNTEKKSKNLIYKKILSKENIKKKLNANDINELINSNKKIYNIKCNYKKYNNKLIKNKDKESFINYYTAIANNIKDNYNNNNGSDISNDFYNYCLEDIDKPINMIYSKNEYEENESNDDSEIINLKQIKTSDKRLFMNFNYIQLNPKIDNKKFIYKNRSKTKKNKLFISKINSIFILNNYKSKEINKIFIEKIEKIINDISYIYKYNFFKRIKGMKFKSIMSAIFENNKIYILKKYFDKYKIKIKDNNDKMVIENINNNEARENIDKKNKSEKKFELFRINLLKYIFHKK